MKIIFTLLLLPYCFFRSHQEFAVILVGKPAPDFTLDFATKDTIIGDGFTLSKEIGKSVIILAFILQIGAVVVQKKCAPCAIISENFSELNAAVYGISGDYPYSHKAWAKEHNLPLRCSAIICTTLQQCIIHSIVKADTQNEPYLLLI